MTDDVTEDDLLDAIREYLEESGADTDDREPGTITRPEMVAQFKLAKGKAEATIDRLIEDSIIEPDMVWRRDDWGYSTRRRGYRYTGEKHDPPTKDST